MSGQILSQLAMRPWYASTTCQRNRRGRPEGTAWTGSCPRVLLPHQCASVLAPDKAKNVADEFALILFDRVNLKTQPNGIHLFLDIEQLAHAGSERTHCRRCSVRETPATPGQSQGATQSTNGRKGQLGVDGLLAGPQKEAARCFRPGYCPRSTAVGHTKNSLTSSAIDPAVIQSLIGFGVHGPSGDRRRSVDAIGRSPGLDTSPRGPTSHNTGAGAPDHERRWPLPPWIVR
jgi:hypothetical protein